MTHHRPTKTLTTLLAAALLIATMPASAAVPVTIASHGVMRGLAGGVVADGVYNLTFSLYAKKDDKAAAWVEGPVPVAVSGGHFAHVLGSLKPLSPALVSKSGGFLGVAVGTDPELPRQPLHSVAFAMSAAAADKLQCSGCVGGTELAAAAVTAQHVGFAYAGAKVKGGPANAALDVQCTGCVGVAEMKFDGDVDLSGHALKVGKMTADSVVAKTVSAASFVGDGSKLTGVQSISGKCAKAGEVVQGIAADGSLLCVKAMDPSALPPDGLNEISNDLLSNQFTDETASSNTPVAIKDNNPTGTSDELTFPDIGTAQKLTVTAHVTTSNLNQLTLTLFGPDNSKYVLHEKAGTGTKLDAAWPPTKTVSGDLSSWIGKNPKGKWRLLATDHTFLNNKTDGEIVKWSIAISTLSNQKVAAQGRLIAQKGVTLGAATVPCNASTAGTISWDGKFLQVCNGKKRYPIILGTPGSVDNPAKSCRHIRDENASAVDGEYWIDPDGSGGVGAFKAYCLMSKNAGGWTKVSEFAATFYQNLPIAARNALRWREVLILEFDHPGNTGTFTKQVTQQTCYNTEKQGFQTTAASGAHCDTGIQVRVGGTGGSCGNDENGCFGVYKGKLNKAWGCNWDCSSGAVQIWGKGYNCNACRCRNAPHTTTAGCGNAGGWSNFRFHMYVR